jgi:hypothetical protein
MAAPLLPIADMDQRHRGLTPAIAASFYEAARVCLDRHHESPTDFTIRNPTGESTARVEWSATDARCRDAWANELDTTEAGAYACALAATELRQQLYAVRRAEQGSGADYYVGPPEAGRDDLEDLIRLEVSGLNAGSTSALERRLADKLEQTDRGTSNLPAIAAVVGFRERRILLSAIITSL